MKFLTVYTSWSFLCASSFLPMFYIYGRPCESKLGSCYTFLWLVISLLTSLLLLYISIYIYIYHSLAFLKFFRIKATRIWDRCISPLKVDHEDHFQHPGFLHIIMCVFLVHKVKNFVKNIGCYRCLKNSKICRV